MQERTDSFVFGVGATDGVKRARTAPRHETRATPRFPRPMPEEPCAKRRRTAVDHTEKLNDDTLGAIFSALPDADLLRSGQVRKRWALLQEGLGDAAVYGGPASLAGRPRWFSALGMVRPRPSCWAAAPSGRAVRPFVPHSAHPIAELCTWVVCGAPLDPQQTAALGPCTVVLVEFPGSCSLLALRAVRGGANAPVCTAPWQAGMIHNVASPGAVVRSAGPDCAVLCWAGAPCYVVWWARGALRAGPLLH